MLQLTIDATFKTTGSSAAKAKAQANLAFHALRGAMWFAGAFATRLAYDDYCRVPSDTAVAEPRPSWL